MAFGRKHSGRVFVSLFIAMAFSTSLLQSSRARFINGTPPAVEEMAAPSTQRAPRLGGRAAEDSEREVPTGPDPLHHHFHPKVRP